MFYFILSALTAGVAVTVSVLLGAPVGATALVGVGAFVVTEIVCKIVEKKTFQDAYTKVKDERDQIIDKLMQQIEIHRSIKLNEDSVVSKEEIKLIRAAQNTHEAKIDHLEEVSQIHQKEIDKCILKSYEQNSPSLVGVKGEKKLDRNENTVPLSSTQTTTNINGASNNKPSNQSKESQGISSRNLNKTQENSSHGKLAANNGIFSGNNASVVNQGEWQVKRKERRGEAYQPTSSTQNNFS